MDRRDPEAVLITGVFGSGKTSVAEEIADLLEKRNLPHALLDLDYLMWFHTGHVDDKAADPMMLSNLAALVGNYLAVGVRFFILAGAIADKSQLEGLRLRLAMSLKVVRLTVFHLRGRKATPLQRHDGETPS